MIHRKTFAALSFLLIAAMAPAITLAGPKDGRLDIYWIDVEGGAATLIVTPAGESLLIDSGNAGPRDPDRINRALTQQAGLARIDHLIITHYHSDHLGGASYLAKVLPIGTLYDNGEFEGQPNQPTKEYLALKCDARKVIEPGDLLPLKQAKGKTASQLKVTCLGARQQFLPAGDGAAKNDLICADAREKNRDGSDNANSVTTLVEFGDFRFFDAGDLTWNVETKLVCPVNLVGQVDVYQVTHHGLDSSNNPLVLRSLLPTVAVMNNGTTKGCLPEVFATLKDTPSLAAIYQLHKNLREDGATNNVADEFIANKEKECKGNYVKLSVAPDGKSYTVAIPANNHEQTYQTRAGR